MKISALDGLTKMRSRVFVLDSNGKVIARGYYVRHSSWMTVIHLDRPFAPDWYRDFCYMNEFVRLDPFQDMIYSWSTGGRNLFLSIYFPELFNEQQAAAAARASRTLQPARGKATQPNRKVRR